MFITLIAALAAGFLGAGFVMLLRFVMRRFGVEHRLPGWATPVAAGGFMLAATISSEYVWFQQSSAQLPDGLEVVATRERQAPWQPWTYVKPYVGSYVAFDGDSVRANSDDPDLLVADVFLFARWQGTRQLQVAFDCGTGRRADPAEGVAMDAEGRPTGVAWREVPGDDPLYAAACN